MVAKYFKLFAIIFFKLFITVNGGLQWRASMILFLQVPHIKTLKTLIN